MVFFFDPCVPGYTIYMGRDKEENELLIKYGLPNDIWFHVDNLSSAHVYLRMKEDQTIEDIPDDILQECLQLVKANSIKGCKMTNIHVVYTPHSNLKKTGDMATGQVGFHNNKAVKRVLVAKRINAIVNRLDKTKKELNPDLRAEREQYEIQQRKKREAEKKKKAKEEKQQMLDAKEAERIKRYEDVMVTSLMKTNKEVQTTVEEYEDDFM
mmetsp:Transcript_23025/g.39161  ORF Transcript_23025/g.39161 Transcript_23025/m.39161 type:complete len:211 (+) Transcript_23025:35-667(+)